MSGLQAKAQLQTGHYSSLTAPDDGCMYPKHVELRILQ